jgi:subtilisin family serine protease
MMFDSSRAWLESLPNRAMQPLEVAVIDSGVDASHPDLAGKVAAAFVVEQLQGKLVTREVGPDTNNDSFGHGTGVASIITRLAPNARVVDIRVLGGTQSGGSMLIEGLRVAVARRCPVINMSLAATANIAQALFGLCEVAYRHGLIVVASKRNMPLVDNGFPAEFSTCIGVDCGRLTEEMSVVYRAGDPIEFVGHGEDVVVAAPGGGYTTKTGTSFATPALSALCARMLGACPALRPFEVKALLKCASQR